MVRTISKAKGSVSTEREVKHKRFLNEENKLRVDGVAGKGGKGDGH